MRVKRGVTSHARHKKIRTQVKGMSLSRRSSVKKAREATYKAMAYSYRDRRTKKRDFRSLWISRISAGLEKFGLSYSQFMGAAKKSHIELDRKILSELSTNHPQAFEAVVKATKQG